MTSFDFKFEFKSGIFDNIYIYERSTLNLTLVLPCSLSLAGLKTMHQLTKEEPYELMVTMARGAETAQSFYSDFK